MYLDFNAKLLNPAAIYKELTGGYYIRFPFVTQIVMANLAFYDPCRSKYKLLSCRRIIAVRSGYTKHSRCLRISAELKIPSACAAFLEQRILTAGHVRETAHIFLHANEINFYSYLFTFSFRGDLYGELWRDSMA